MKARLLSSSYIPLEQDEKFEMMTDDLLKLYKKYEVNDEVIFHLETKIFIGKIK